MTAARARPVTCWVTALLCVIAYRDGTSQQSGLSTPDPQTTYQRMLIKAEEGDLDVQNLIGYMFFHGEGIAQNMDEAHSWFHRAAEQGHRGAQRNLAVFHSGALADVPPHFFDLREAAYWFGTGFLKIEISPEALDTLEPEAAEPILAAAPSQIPTGRETERAGFLVFCARCHKDPSHSSVSSIPDIDIPGSASGIAGLPLSPRFLLSAAPHSDPHGAIRTAVGPTLLAIFYRFARSGKSPGHEPAESDAGSLYSTFCAGCHGFNGISYFVASPSFALGERMEKSDLALQLSITNGRGAMPGWGGKLTERQIIALIGFVRGLKSRFDQGIAANLRNRPGLFFIFRPLSESDSWWAGSGDAEVLNYWDN